MALLDLLTSKVKGNKRQKTFKCEHKLLLKSVVLFRGHVVRSAVQRPMQEWAMMWLALHAREQQPAFYVTAVLNWHQVCAIDKTGKTNGIGRAVA